jgi:peptide/nickel transport system permease protein
LITADELAEPNRPALLIRRTGWLGAVGGAMVAAIVLLAVFGPLLAPHDPAALVGVPLQSPSHRFLLGTDFLGRDVLSRVMYGGRTVLALALAATIVAYAIGLTLGLIAGFVRGFVDPVIMRCIDILISVPPLLFLLVLATGAGHNVVVLVLGVAIVNVPGITRILRSAVLEVSVTGYVEAAIVRGETLSALLRREVLPNVAGVIFADVGVRLSGTILLVAAVNFLGLGLQPPTADWALMVSENRNIMTVQPWTVAAPAILIAVLTIGVNLVADGISRALGTSFESTEIVR